MIPRAARSIALVAMLVATLACSEETNDDSGSGGETTTATGGSGGSGATGGGATGGSGGEVCADHDNTASVIQAVMVADNVPAASGGSLARGTYHLVELIRYTGPGGDTGPTTQQAQETSVWSADTLRTALDLFDGEGERRMEMVYDTADADGPISFNVTCPEPLSVPWDGYTATPTKLTLYGTASKVAFVYDKQPE